MNFKRIVLTSALGAAAILFGAACLGQEPDARGEIGLREPSYRGTRANAPIPPGDHIRNEGGSDGAGLCVIASLVINGRYQQVPGLEGGKDSALWKAAKSRPGGYHPEKLEKLLKEVMPGEKWVSYYGKDPAILDGLSARGYPIGATMNTGAFYNYQPIHHMISLIHFKSGGLACVVDNNDPGVYHWMPAAEFLRRWYDGGNGWAFAWSRLPVPARTVTTGAVAASGALLMFSVGAAVFIGVPLSLSKKE